MTSALYVKAMTSEAVLAAMQFRLRMFKQLFRKRSWVVRRLNCKTSWQRNSYLV